MALLAPPQHHKPHDQVDRYLFVAQCVVAKPSQQNTVFTSCSHSSTPMPTQTRTNRRWSSDSSAIRLLSAHILYQVQKQGSLNPGRRLQTYTKSFGLYELLATRQHISFAIAPRHISNNNDPHTSPQLKTPRLGDDRLAYLGSPGTKHLGLYQPQVGGDCRTRTKMSFEPSSVRHFRTISDDPARLVRCEDAADRPPGRETSILRPSTARA